jgi:hypothetical protein
MVSLVEVYERQAVDCVQAAARIDDPNYREMLLKMADAWRMEAAALRASAQAIEAPRAERPAH